MAYEVKITDEAALKSAHPDLFKINERLLKKRLLAAKTLGQEIPGAALVKVQMSEPIASNPDEAELVDVPGVFKRKEA